MSIKLITPPKAGPLHVADVRQHLKQDIADDDNLIGIYLGSALQEAESKTGRQLVAARFQLVMDDFPSCAIQLPRSPLIQVVSIQYTDTAGITQTVPSTDYTVDQGSEVPRITPVYGKSWSSVLAQIGSVLITFDAGYVAVMTASGNNITVKGWRDMVVGDVVRLSNSGGELPAPLQSRTDYFIQSVVSPGVYTLAATAGGAAIALTNAGSGINFIGQTGLNGSAGEIPDGIRSWMLLRCESLYTHRGETLDARGTLNTLPYVDRLLDPYKTYFL